MIDTPVRLRPAPTLGDRDHGQCQYPTERMSSPDGYLPGWRQKRYEKTRKDPRFCVKGAAIKLGDRKFCALHAGRILLAQHLGEPDPSVISGE